MGLEIHTIVSMPFAENTYVVWRSDRAEALVIDPGLEPELILSFLNERQLQVAAILNTHGHADHIGGNRALKSAFPTAPLVIGTNEAHLLTDANANLSACFGLPVTSPPADQLVNEGDAVEFAGIRLEVLDVPGHSPGHIVYVYRNEPGLVFGGDVLFRGGIGRFDFPGCDGELLFRGIRTKLFALPDATVVYPGHGPVTERRRSLREKPRRPGPNVPTNRNLFMDGRRRHVNYSKRGHRPAWYALAVWSHNPVWAEFLQQSPFLVRRAWTALVRELPLAWAVR